MVRELWEQCQNLPPGDRAHKCCKSLSMRINIGTISIKRQIQEKKEIISKLQEEPQSNEIIENIKALNGKIDVLELQEEMMWLPRSRQNWITEGDRNIGFFHQKAMFQERRNTIQGIMSEDGYIVHDQEDIETVFVDYFQKLFKSSSPQNLNAVLGTVQERVTKTMNKQLLRPYTGDEVYAALKQMHPTKAAGPDGVPALFYHLYWNIVESDTIDTVLNILNNGACPRALNRTFIALVPKVKSPKSPMSYRPISRCNVLNKLVSKVITNRLKERLPAIIPEAQSAFVPGRLITDNVLIAFEHFHYLKKKRKGKRGFMALKLDMRKAYDRIEWEFLHCMLLKLGFDAQWVNLVRRRVTTVSYANGQPTRWFEPCRGL